MASISERRSEGQAITLPLENLSLLEKKITHLIELVKAEREVSAQLMQERNALSARLEMLEGSLLKETKSIEELIQEREMMKLLVDEMIGNIDQLVAGMPVHSGELVAK